MSSSLTDKEYYNLSVSVSKAFSSFEAPIKSKHVRAVIIGTYHSNGGQAFWAIATRQQLQDNRIIAWKFCYVVHKLLREGHHLVPQHSMRHRSMITELGKLWGHLNDGYGLCIKQYTKLLVTKLNFHDRNPKFPGSLVLKHGELEKIAANDINVYFQLAIEMFDYLDDIIGLQATIFNSITKFGVSSMTSPGQCRLAPLIPCIQDSNQLYDFCVRLMFLLHAQLPEDLLTGHRERFRVIFRQLNHFYKQASPLQYFANLITVPRLPTNHPNFLEQSDLGNYKAPVVVIPQETQEDNNSIVENLVDMSAPSTTEPELPPRAQTPQAPPLPAIDFDRLIRERDDIIRNLQQDNEKQKHFNRTFVNEKTEFENQTREHIAKMNSELTNTQNELFNLRSQKEELELKLQTAPVLEQKVQAEEERAKASEEKFQKLKNMYTQIREEHIKLLRQHGEVSKQLVENTKQVSEASIEKEELKAKLQEVETEKLKVSETLQQSSEEVHQEKLELSMKVQQLEQEKSSLIDQFKEIESSKTAEIIELKVTLETLQNSLDEIRENTGKLSAEKAELEQSSEEVVREKEEFSTKIKELEQEKLSLMDQVHEIESCKTSEVSELKISLEELQRNLEELRENAGKISAEKEKLELEYQDTLTKKTKIEEVYHLSLVSLEKLKSVEGDKENLETERNIQIAENQSLNEQLNQRHEEYNALETKLNETLESKTIEIEELQTQIQEKEEAFKNINANYDRVLSEKETFESDIQDLLHQQEQLDQSHKDTLAKVNELENELLGSKIHGETSLRALLEACIKTSEKITIRAIADSETSGASGTPTYFIMVAEELQDVLRKLKIVHENYLKDNNNNVEALVRKVIAGGHLLASVHEQGLAVCNKSTNIDSGEKIADQIKEFGQSTAQLFQSLHTSSKSDQVGSQIDAIKDQLSKITNMIGDLNNNNDEIDKLGDLVEKELIGMDEAIEEATKKITDMLAQSKASDSGMKLEVNEKILDACTTLMKSIQILVQKSRKVQAEIIASGKGTASAKEYYKRNHQWTEGLISASKAVAQGANFLVEAADKSANSPLESKHTLNIIVAAQEIAACTAQLVVASKVKAPKHSQGLQELTQASKNVKQSTATVVATAKDCGNRLEESQDLDLTKLTIHQSKTKEIEVQVKILSLEQDLQSERMKLAALRRQNYQSEN